MNPTPTSASAATAAAAPSTLLSSLRFRLACLQPCFLNGRILYPSATSAWPRQPLTEDTCGPSTSPVDRQRVYFSCVVVPPPVPAARAAFERHTRTLIERLAPEFITVTSYSSYFTHEEEELEALAGRDGAKDAARTAEEGNVKRQGELSAAQQAIHFLRSVRNGNMALSNGVTPLVLTLTATRATFAVPATTARTSRAAAPESDANTSAGSDKPRASQPSVGPLDTLTGATARGITATIASFYHILAAGHGVNAPQAAADASGGEVIAAASVGGLMVLRGDDRGFTRSSALQPPPQARDSPPATAASTCPYRDFEDGTALLTHCRATLTQLDRTRHAESGNVEKSGVVAGDAAGDAGDATTRLSLFTGGYPQGHCLERCWQPLTPSPPESPVEHAGHRGSTARTPQQRSLAFLQDMDTLLDETNVPRRHRGAEDEGRAPRGEHSLKDVREAVAETVARTEKLLRRVREGACRLFTTPSSHAPRARKSRGGLHDVGGGEGAGDSEETQAAPRTAADMAAFRQHIRDGLVRPKLLPSAGDGGGGASVVVTQMISSASEFLTYADVVHEELVDAFAQRTSSDARARADEDVVVVVVPGIMAPLPAEDYVRTVLQLKVVPSPILFRALMVYADALAACVAALQAEAAEADGAGAARLQAALNTFDKRKRALEADFEAVMEEDCVGMCEAVHEQGYRHVNISCFSYHCGPAVTRVAERLNRRSTSDGGGKSDVKESV